MFFRKKKKKKKGCNTNINIWQVNEWSGLKLAVFIHFTQSVGDAGGVHCNHRGFKHYVFCVDEVIRIFFFWTSIHFTLQTL